MNADLKTLVCLLYRVCDAFLSYSEWRQRTPHPPFHLCLSVLSVQQSGRRRDFCFLCAKSLKKLQFLYFIEW